MHWCRSALRVTAASGIAAWIAPGKTASKEYVPQGAAIKRAGPVATGTPTAKRGTGRGNAGSHRRKK